jgi:uncharacterized protein (DUF58 family)
VTRVECLVWRPTTAHLRAAITGVVLAIAAVAFGRPDLVVLATPMMVVAVWSVLTRPTEVPRVSTALAHRTVREGTATRWTATVSTPEGADQVVAVLGPSRWTSIRPRTGCLSTPVAGGDEEVTLSFDVRSTRWGHRDVAAGLVAVTSSWNAFRSGPTPLDPLQLATLPLPAVFDGRAAVPHPVGLVGLHRSARRGDGSEFAGIRPFQLGDRLRRIHWPVSLRTGGLHVTATYADRDTHVVLVVDAGNDLGESGGVDGSASSLDLTVRAAGALTEHFLRHGDRVGLQVFGTARLTRVVVAGGHAHLVRVLDTLARIEVGTGRDRNARPGRLGIPPGGLVVMLSPMISPIALAQAVTLARRRLTVVVVDTMPADLGDSGDDPNEALAWRIRLLERAREVRRVQEAGVPVVAWRGPGSLDQVLRDIGRRSRAPHMVAR